MDIDPINPFHWSVSVCHTKTTFLVSKVFILHLTTAIQLFYNIRQIFLDVFIINVYGNTFRNIFVVNVLE